MVFALKIDSKEVNEFMCRTRCAIWCPFSSYNYTSSCNHFDLVAAVIRTHLHERNKLVGTELLKSSTFTRFILKSEPNSLSIQQCFIEEIK